MKDLVTTLDLLDRSEPRHASHRYVDQEFLAFLRSVQNRRSRNERVVLFAEPDGLALSERLTRWLSRHPQVSAELPTGSEAWKQRVVEWMNGMSASPSSEPAPSGLPKFLSAAARWKRTSDDGPVPFAWTLE